MKTYEYSKLSRNYTLFWCIAVLLVVSITEFLWINAERPEIYAVFVLILFAQCFYTERNAKYWAVTLNDEGLCFHEEEQVHQVTWKEIESLKPFPDKGFTPSQYFEAMFSSGVILKDTSGNEYVIYKKIHGFDELINQCNGNI